MKDVLITGGSGAIGSALVQYFLRAKCTNVHLILRAQSPEHLLQRRQDLMKFWRRDSDECEVAVAVHAGNVCQEKLGLSDESYADLERRVTNIVHCAGDVKLNQPLALARASALGAMQNIVQFANRCRMHGQFRKLDVTSTVGIAGRMPGLLPEEPIFTPRRFHNTYEAAKAEAEAFLWREIEHGLPATIHRPSMVIGDSGTGRIIRFQVFYYLCEFLSGSRSWGYLPQLGDSRLDTIPVDYVARAIFECSQLHETAGQILHLCSGPDNSRTLQEISEAVRSFYESQGAKIYRTKQLPRWVFRPVIQGLQLFVTGQQRHMLKNAPYFLEYLCERQSFDVTKTCRILRPLGLEIPSFIDYIVPVLRFQQNVGRRMETPRRSTDRIERHATPAAAGR